MLLAKTVLKEMVTQIHQLELETGHFLKARQEVSNRKLPFNLGDQNITK